jgi:hypothetical protein
MQAGDVTEAVYDRLRVISSQLTRILIEMYDFPRSSYANDLLQVALCCLLWHVHSCIAEAFLSFSNAFLSFGPLFMQYVLRCRDEKDILKFSLICRIASVALALLSSVFVKPFDTSGLLLLEDDAGGPLAARLALSFVQWDTLHFLKIAKDGYAQEQSFAFSPGVPLILRVFGKLFNEDFQAAQAVLCTVVLVNLISLFLPILLYR